MDTIQTSPTMVWTTEPPNFGVPACVIQPEVPNLFLNIPGTSVPELALGLGATAIQPPGLDVTTASLVGTVLGMGVRGVLGYFIGKWTNSSKGWTAAGAALLGVPGTAAAVYFSGTKTSSTRKNRSRKVCRNASKGEKIIASSFERYNGGVRIKRQWGSSTVTRFYVRWASDKNDAAKWDIIEGFGKTPGERKTYAMDVFRAKHGGAS